MLPAHKQGAAGKPIPVPTQPPFAHANQKGGHFRCGLPRHMRAGHCTAMGTMPAFVQKKGASPSGVETAPPVPGSRATPTCNQRRGGGQDGVPTPAGCPTAQATPVACEKEGGTGVVGPPSRLGECPSAAGTMCGLHVRRACPVTWGPRCCLWIPHSPLSCVAFVCKRGRGSFSCDPLPCVGA